MNKSKQLIPEDIEDVFDIMSNDSKTHVFKETADTNFIQ